MHTFAARLLLCIEERHTTQAELARRAGVSAASISDWARTVTSPDNIKAEPLLKAAAFLQVNPMWLLKGQGARWAHSPTVVQAAEGSPRYTDWPFTALDLALIRKLKPHDLARLEGAWLLAATQLGFRVDKQAAA